MSQEYPLPNYINPLKGITDPILVEYWIEYELLDLDSYYIRHDLDGKIHFSPLENHAETVDILLLVNNNPINPQYTSEVCNSITFDQMVELYQRAHSYSLDFTFTSFQYKQSTGDIYYSIIELLKNMKQSEIDMYINEYSEEYPHISLLLLAVLGSNEQLETTLQSKQELNLSRCIYKDYLICSTICNTFNPDIYMLFKKSNDIEDCGFEDAMMYSPNAIQHMINDLHNDKLSSSSSLSSPLYNFDQLLQTYQDNMHLFNAQCVDILHSSNVCNDILPLLYAYIELNNINKVKSLLGYNTTPTVSIIGSEEILYRARSAEMVHLLVSCKACVKDRDEEPLISAAIQGRSLDVVKALLSHKASLDCDKDGIHPLHNLHKSSPDVIKFLVSFLSSSHQVNNNNNNDSNTTGLTDDTYNYIKTSLSNIDINNLRDADGHRPLYNALQDSIYSIYLLENNISPHIYEHIDTSNYTIFNTYNDVLSQLNNTTTDVSKPSYRHYIDGTRMVSQIGISYNRFYYNMYNLMKYKAYPLTYLSQTNQDNTTSYYSYLTRAIIKKHLNFITLLVQYLSPLNIQFSVFFQEYNPLELLLSEEVPRKDITYELIQYGAIYSPKDSEHVDELDEGIQHLILDQCYQ